MHVDFLYDFGVGPETRNNTKRNKGAIHLSDVRSGIP